MYKCMTNTPKCTRTTAYVLFTIYGSPGAAIHVIRVLVVIAGQLSPRWWKHATVHTRLAL